MKVKSLRQPSNRNPHQQMGTPYTQGRFSYVSEKQVLSNILFSFAELVCPADTTLTSQQRLRRRLKPKTNPT